MADYKHTLNLPQTDFPMRANLPAREPETLRAWAELGLYERLRRERAGRPRYVLHDGPPYANGVIHLGHVVNKVLKDIIVKARTLDGCDAPFVPGWDCHGLPIEHVVEKRLGKPGVQVDAAAFRAACREYAAGQVAAQRADFERLGVIGDWQHPYLTMEPATEAAILRAFGALVAAGYVVRGERPVHWCLDCASALAEAEVEYQLRDDPEIDVCFVAADAARALAAFGLPAAGPAPAVVIWTTTPWTLPANQAVALHPGLEYVLVEYGRDAGPARFVVAAELLEACARRWGAPAFHVLGRCRGQALEGLPLRHPFLPREVPVVLGEHVTTEAGTGAVHTAPGHGAEDFAAGRRYGLAVECPVGGDGRFVDRTPHVAGKTVFEANPRLVELLRERGALLHAGRIEHSYPHCWRHKTPTIVRATPQWFIRMEHEDLRGRALAAIRATRWTPDWGEARIHGMVAARPDWCISRQRAWGVPLALFLHRHTGALHPRTTELIEAVAQRVEAGGVEAWFALDPAELLGTQASDYIKVTDILDVWFDSGVTHAAVLERRPELGFPADLYLEGSDQHRGWFHSSLLTAVALRGAAPYRGVLTHGFTVDAAGLKMSKSRGNAVVPQDVLGTLGADILRLWVASTDYRGEMGISQEILTRSADAYRRLRNTARFLLANLAGFDATRDQVPVAQLVALDRWVLARAAQLDAEIRRAYRDFEFHLVCQKVLGFCSVELGSLYLDIIKDRQYTTPADSHARRSCQTALAHLLELLVRWLAPILSFTAEEIWRHAPGARPPSVLLAEWYDPPQAGEGEIRAAEWAALGKAREAANRELERLRVAGDIGSALDAELDVYAGGALADVLARLGEERRFYFITSEVRVHPRDAAPPEAVVVDATMALTACVSPHPKCTRCWHHRPDVGRDARHAQLCGRCVQNVEGPGEIRRYA